MGKFAVRSGVIGFAVLASAFLGSSARATDFDFAGMFAHDNDVLKFNFTVAAPSTVTVFSSSWVTGGFDPILSLWDSTGNKVAQQDDGHVLTGGTSNSVFYATGDWDSYYTVGLGAGDYTVAITQYNNFSVGNTLAQGFVYDGASHAQFTHDLAFGSAPMFNGVLSGSDTRTANWAFHLLNVDTATVIDPNVVPLPSAVWAGMSLLGGLGLVRKVRGRKA